MVGSMSRAQGGSSCQSGCSWSWSRRGWLPDHGVLNRSRLTEGVLLNRTGAKLGCRGRGVELLLLLLLLRLEGLLLLLRHKGGGSRLLELRLLELLLLGLELLLLLLELGSALRRRPAVAILSVTE